MSRVIDAPRLARDLTAARMHAAKATRHLNRAGEARGAASREEAWLDALDEVRQVLDAATGLRVLFERLSDEANGVSPDGRGGGGRWG